MISRSQTDAEAPTEAVGPPSALTDRRFAAGIPPADELAAPSVVAERYELVGLLGVGGMGAVYRARDRVLGEVVALKMLRGVPALQPRLVERFRQEVRLSRRVTHANVARMYDIGEQEGQPFLTMELIEGEPLSQLIKREGPPPVPRAVALLVEICRGLAAAHGAGIVHRDLKPHNVLLGKDGRVVVSDFGIARAFGAAAGEPEEEPGSPTVAAEPAGPRTQPLLGTPDYMAPEQVFGTADVDAPAEIYALGVVMFELLTGARPFSGGNGLAIALSRLEAPVPDPRARCPALPEGLAAICRRAMARQPGDRFPTVEELEVALRSFLAEVKPAAPSPRRALAARVEASLSRSVGVLPLRSGAPEDEYLASGFTLDLIESLSLSPALNVRTISRGAPELDPRSAGEELGVDVVLTGSLHRTSAGLRLALRLLAVADGVQLWATRVVRPLPELLDLADEVAVQVATLVSVEPPPAPPAAPVDAAALDLYLRGRHEHHRFSASSTRRALELLARAHQLAPDCHTITAGYALALARHFSVDVGEPDQEALARSLAGRLLQVVPQMAEPRLVLATLDVNLGDGLAAARQLHAVLLASPALVDAQEMCGRLLVELGRLQQGIALLELALRAEPRLSRSRYDLSRALGLAGDLEPMRAIFSQLPDDGTERSLHALGLGRLCIWFGDRAWARAARCTFEPLAFDYKAEVLHVLDVVADHDPRGAAQLCLTLERLSGNTRVPRQRAYYAQLATEVLALTRQSEAALGWLERADREGLFDIGWLGSCPVLGRLRGEARFQAVERSVAARASAILAVLDPPG